MSNIKINGAFIDQKLGIGSTAKSARESAGVFVKNEIEQALSKPTKITAEGIDAGFGIGRTVKSAEESANVFIENAGKKTGFFKNVRNKILNFFKGAGAKFKALPKAGKIGIIAAGVAALGALLYGLFGGKDEKSEISNTVELPENYNPQVPDVKNENPTQEQLPVTVDNKDDKVEQQTPVAVVPIDNKDDKTEEQAPVQSDAIENDTVQEPIPVVVPVDNEDKDAEPVIQNDEIKSEDEVTSEVETEEAPVASEDENIHTVVYGDCVWNIAKAHLIELHKDEEGYKPTNAEILKHTRELMKINSLHLEPDNYHCKIYPGDKIKLVA